MIAFTHLRMVTAIVLFAASPLRLTSAAEPLRAHPQNPYILEFRDKPTVLRTFAEHYSSVLNSSFDYTPYVNTLQRDGMNLTRAFLVGFRLVEGDAAGVGPLKPTPAQFLQPWNRSNAAGAALDGLGKWDFSSWNENYFTRLRSFVQACSDRGIVVELTLFCTFYAESHWRASPLHPANNVQGYGPANRYDAFRPVNANLLAVQEAVVRRIVRELINFDNIFYEIENEPFWDEVNVKDDQEVSFHNRFLGIIRNEESRFGRRHLVAHNFPQHAGSMSADFDIINEHYPVTPTGSPIAGTEALLRNHYQRGEILSCGETDTPTPLEMRLESWMFLLGGGGIYNGLDVPHFVYSTNDESGGSALGAGFRTVVRNVGSYVDSLQLTALRRNLSWVAAGVPAGANLQAMANPGQQYVAYLHHGRGGGSYYYNPIDSSNHPVMLTVSLPAGSWRAVWTKPSDLTELARQEFNHGGGTFTLRQVTYQADVALRIDRTGAVIGDPEPGPATSGFRNGSFEENFIGWTATGNMQIGGPPFYLPTDGSRLIAFNNSQKTPNGVLSQTFSTTPGGSYTLTFDMGTKSYNTSEQRLQVDMTGISAPVSQLFTIHGAGAGNTKWAAISIPFTASGSSCTVTFRDKSLFHDSIDLLLDNVRFGGQSSGPVIPEPVTPEPVTSGFSNGSFEEIFVGWTATGNLQIGAPTFYQPTDGSRLVAFNASQKTPSGVLSQTFSTTPGGSYSLNFDMGTKSYNTNAQRLQVDMTGSSAPISQLFTIHGAGAGNTNWAAKSIPFTASGASCTVTFRDRSLVTDSIDLLLDSVQIAAP